MKFFQIALTLFCLLAVSTALHAEADKPNILFILVDDLGWGDLGCYGNKRIKTPSLDKLAREGTIFTQYYQGGSVCSPSRGCLMTGRWPAELKIHGHYATPELNRRRSMGNFLDPSEMTLPRLLQKSGYRTIHVGKWHLGKPPGVESGENTLGCYGFDESRWVDVAGQLDGVPINLWSIKHRPIASKTLVDETIEILGTADEKPFYCQLWLNDPHAPLAPSSEQMEPYRKRPHNPTPDGYTAPVEVYGGTVTEMDRQIGRLLKGLDELELSKNTIVIFSSDNGPEDIEIGNSAWSGIGSAGPFRGRKRSLYEGGTRVPFIVRWPGNTPGGQVNDTTVVSGADLLPTLCGLADVDLPESVKGVQRGENVTTAFKGDKSFQRSKPLCWEWRYKVFNHPWNASPILAIRDGRWKLLMNPDRSRIELYDIPSDPGEQTNLAEKNPDTVERLSKTVLDWQKTLPEGPIEAVAGKNDYPWPKEKNLSGNK